MRRNSDFDCHESRQRKPPKNSRGPITVLLLGCVTRKQKEQPLKFLKFGLLDFPSKVLYFPDLLAIFSSHLRLQRSQLQVLLPVWADSKVRFGDSEPPTHLRRIDSVAVVCCCLAHLCSSLRMCSLLAHSLCFKTRGFLPGNVLRRAAVQPNTPLRRSSRLAGPPSARPRFPLCAGRCACGHSCSSVCGAGRLVSRP